VHPYQRAAPLPRSTAAVADGGKTGARDEELAGLVGYDEKLRDQADILESFEVENDRVFTFKIREGHRWSDGHP
jgi:ABC-type transport system substrate-binding protein